MSMRHLPADRIQKPAQGAAGQVPLALPSVMSSYGSMPQSATNVVMQAAQAMEYRLKGQLPVTKSGFIHYVSPITALICFLPCWDAVQMLRNCNFVQWMGISYPLVMLVVCIFVMVIFFSMVDSVFSQDGFFSNRHGATMREMALICSTVTTVLGLLLVVVSLPLSHASVSLANELAYNCHGLPKARDVAIAYQSLAALRAAPACAALESVEECDGFVETPEVWYLRGMEGNFVCSGFCVPDGVGVAAVPEAPAADVEQPAAEQSEAEEPAAAVPAAAEPAPEEPSAEAGEAEAPADTVEAEVGADGDASLFLVHGKLQRHLAGKTKTADRAQEVAQASGRSEEVDAAELVVKPPVAMVSTWLNGTQPAVFAQPPDLRSGRSLASLVHRSAAAVAQPATLPPTLFSHANYQTSCDGAASRDLRNFSSEIGWQSWYTGITLVSVSILIGVAEWSNVAQA